MMAAIVIIILASIVLAITVVIAGALLEEVVRDVLVTREQLKATHAAWEARERVFNTCIEQGRTPVECGAVAAQVVPMPPMVVRDLPGTLPWLKWVTIGLITLTVAGFGIWGISKLSGNKKRGLASGDRRARPSFRELSPDEFMDPGAGGDYAMEDVE
jgi:hypothetical protein